MIKLKCTKCGKIWYTAYTQEGQICNDCDGLLVEIVDDKVNQKVEEVEKTQSKSFLKFFKRK